VGKGVGQAKFMACRWRRGAKSSRRDEISVRSIRDGEIADEPLLSVTKRRQRGVSCRLCQPATKRAPAVRPANRALCRNPLAACKADA